MTAFHAGLFRRIERQYQLSYENGDRPGPSLTNTGGKTMKVKDIVNNNESELSRDELVQKMKEGRQVDLILKEKKTDDIGYLTWDMEQWSTVDGKRFIRTYQLEGRVLSEYTSHNIHDLNAYFFPDEAAAVQLS